MIVDMRTFPLPVITETNKDVADRIVQLVAEIQGENAQKMLDMAKMKEIDRLVLKLYGIVEEEEVKCVLG